MIPRDRSDSFLMDLFREFYYEVIRQKHLIAKGLSEIKLDSEPLDSEENKLEHRINAVWRTLLTLMEKQRADVNRVGGGYILELCKEAQNLLIIVN